MNFTKVARASDVPEFPALAADGDADVCVVGAGIAGLTVAYTLARAGRRVVVLDDGPIGGGETGRTTAHLSDALDDRYYEIERVHGELGARMAAESHAAAINRIEEIVRLEGIDCDFARLDGFLFLAPEDDEKELERERDAAHRASLSDVELLPRLPVEFHDFGPCLRFPRQARFHVLKYLAGLARAAVGAGARIHTGSHVSEMSGAKEGASAFVKTDAGRTVKARAIVVATNSPINDWVKMHTKQAPYRTYVVGMRVPRDAVRDALYWDTGDPYYYVRLQHDEGGEVLVVGGEDHKTGQADDMDERFRRLEQWTRAHFPMAGEVAYRWSGQVMEPVDYMGFIGRNPGDDDVYIATGDSGQGMTHGTIAGILIPDLILGRDNPWTKLYDPSRVSLRTAPEFARENLNVAAQYRDYLTPGDVASADDIPRGEGRVLRRGAAKVAVYRDDAGTLHERSAVCPHLYCIVDWNQAEKSWDCPCHGSRFDAYGRVVNGPASSDLAAVDPQSEKDAPGR
jgi:glycine/D-amino acid oxidase-like deaminating enzyme/nitrite reductase/ring-hydroxylating ferredoxin subunit